MIEFDNNITIAFMADRVYKNALAHGFYDRIVTLPELLCLIHKEVSEVLEAYDNHDNENLAEELADVIILTLSISTHLGVDMEKEIVKKHNKNVGRPYLHGKRF